MQDKTGLNNKALENIARQHLSIETLQTRNSDELDFYNLPVWMIKNALEKEFEAGKILRN